ncbi:CerR family C-terminal domain-containing protein [Sphingomonas sp. HF-S4]|uniref:CerR family C-terminal domain-containing protein n=1 Tax=Sphingomonas agrestis TaxID=3080540 RepID=A0ABU3Y712_9SPHN|nr:CerR family C-terminal domain-containing protein [Sphingomonas sp. HF-S4]MDV3457149.1 CerR family C-terminal domain-containing protein [Sphingomonas sp. HF-S4]
MVSATLLDTAIDQFGRLGFEGASTREIARASGTAMSSITYHFGGKQGLYLAAAEHIAAQIRALQGEPVARAVAAGQQSREAAIEALANVLDGLAQMMLRPETESWSRFIIREQQSPTEAFELLFTRAMQPILDAFIVLIIRARADLARRDAVAMAILLFGQAMVLRAGRAAVCRALGVDQIDEETGALLRNRLRANVLCILSEKPQ